MARAKTKIPTVQEIDNLYKSGDIEALRAINEKLAKRANQRLAEFDKRDMETAAVTRAKGFIQEYKELGNGKNFSRRKSMDIDDLVLNIKEESKFLRSQTSTVSGEMKRREKIFNTLTKKDKNGKSIIPTVSKEETDSYKKKFLDFLDSDVWSEIKKTLYSDTNITMDEAGEAIASGASVEDLEAAFSDYLEGEETDLFEIWDNWRSPS
jgi:hypothetical protein